MGRDYFVYIMASKTRTLSRWAGPCHVGQELASCHRSNQCKVAGGKLLPNVTEREAGLHTAL